MFLSLLHPYAVARAAVTGQRGTRLWVACGFAQAQRAIQGFI